jgi:hypothetical protein
MKPSNEEQEIEPWSWWKMEIVRLCERTPNYKIERILEIVKEVADEATQRREREVLEYWLPRAEGYDVGLPMKMRNRLNSLRQGEPND